MLINVFITGALMRSIWQGREGKPFGRNSAPEIGCRGKCTMSKFKQEMRFIKFHTFHTTTVSRRIYRGPVFYDKSAYHDGMVHSIDPSK
jgi:hypothetical protein